jgi:hypothetical protein
MRGTRRRWRQRFEFGQLVRQPTVPARFGIKIGQINAKIHNQRWADGGKAVASRGMLTHSSVSASICSAMRSTLLAAIGARPRSASPLASESMTRLAASNCRTTRLKSGSLRVGLGRQDAYFDQHCAARARVRSGTGSGRRGGRCRHGWRRERARMRNNENARELVLSEMEPWPCNSVEGKRLNVSR